MVYGYRGHANDFTQIKKHEVKNNLFWWYIIICRRFVYVLCVDSTKMKYRQTSSVFGKDGEDF